MIEKIDVFRHALLHCIVDLAEDAISNYKKNKLITAASITRSLFERESTLYYLYNLINNSIKTNSTIDITKLQRIILGARRKSSINNGDDFPEINSINILTIIEEQIKNEFSESKVQELYDELSNLVHPNYNGVWDAYVILDFYSLNALFECHDKGNIGLTILTGINISISLTMLWHKELSNLLPQYAHLATEKEKTTCQ